MPRAEYKRTSVTYEDLRAQWVGVPGAPGHLVAWWWQWAVRAAFPKGMQPGPVIFSFVFGVIMSGRGRNPDDDDVIGAGLKLLLDAGVVAGMWKDDGRSSVRIEGAEVQRASLAASAFIRATWTGPTGAGGCATQVLPRSLPTLNDLIDAAKFSGMRMAWRGATRKRVHG